MEQQNVETPKRGRKKVELTKDERVLFYSTVNERLEKKITTLCEKDEIKAVRIFGEPKKVFGWLAPWFTEEPIKKGAQTVLEEWLKREGEWKTTLNNAMGLFFALSGEQNVQQAIDRVDQLEFTLTQLARITKNSNSRAKQVLNLLYAFGYISYTKGTHVFRFVFSPTEVSEIIHQELKESIAKLNDNIARYKASVDRNATLDKKEKDDLYCKLNDLIDATIVL